MLRGLVLGLGILAMSGGVLAAINNASGAGLYFLAVGLLLILGTVFERVFYKPVTADKPGAGWADTGERFIDPETGQTVAVYFNQATGERRYVGGKAR
jgi:hypothetical protein